MYKYDIPIFVINEPTEYQINDISKKNFQEKELTLKIRRGADDREIVVNTTDKVEVLIKRYLIVNNASDSKCKLFFGGKEFKPENNIGVYVTKNCVIQGFITG